MNEGSTRRTTSRTQWASGSPQHRDDHADRVLSPSEPLIVSQEPVRQVPDVFGLVAGLLTSGKQLSLPAHGVIDSTTPGANGAEKQGP